MISRPYYFRYKFTHVIRHESGVVELLCDRDTVLSVEMLEDVLDFCTDLASGELYLLINKRNSFSFSLGAIQLLRKYDSLKALAVFSASQSTHSFLEFFMKMTSTGFELKHMEDRDAALAWLERCRRPFLKKIPA
ncbi:MAG: hypothetical protein OEX00_00915 [Gammaproteobacteria bacterium]|nr:hypothetical protein [Gammaproteobacteria bacterium]MDH5692424.1 hypothetical protein [Gammaproteobacteria bacterium]